MKFRFFWADSIRALAIFLVLATHLSYQPDTVTTYGLVYFLYFAIVKTCVPLFVMLSGALLLGKSESYLTFYKKRIGRLLLPWVFWSAVFLFFQKDIFVVNNIPSFFRTFIATMESFWFLPMIVCLYVLTPIIRTFLANASIKEVAYLVLIWFLVISFLPYHINSMTFPRQVDNGLLRQTVNFSGYFILGYLLVNIKTKITPTFSILVFLLGLSWSMAMTLSIILPSQQIMYLFDYIAPGNVLMSFGIFAFIIATLENREFGQGKLKKTIGAISNASLGIYFIHSIIWPILNQNFNLRIYPFPNGVISAVLLFLVCFVIIFFLQQIPILRKLVS